MNHQGDTKTVILTNDCYSSSRSSILALNLHPSFKEQIKPLKEKLQHANCPLTGAMEKDRGGTHGHGACSGRCHLG
ncbi:unnamed protein product [Caretta caretta]